MALITKICLTLTLANFVSAASTFAPCRPACPTPEAVFPHPQDCTKFFHCAYNIPFEKSCPPGLYFSPDLLRCDFPSTVNCLADPSNPCVAPTTETTETSSTDFGHGTNVSSTTPSPSQTSATASPGTEPSSSETPENCKPECPTPEALLAHPRNCQKYYQCAFSTAFEKDCPAGLHFSASSALCDYPELAQCTATEDAPCDEVITVAPTEQPKNPASSSPAGVHLDFSNITISPTPSANSTLVSTTTPNRTLSSSVASTVTPTPTLATNGTASPSFAPNGTVATGIPSLSPNGTVVSTTASMTTPGPTVCQPTCGSSWIFAHPWYCDKFFLCSNHRAVEMTCPEGLHFAEALLRCDFPDLAECTASLDKPCV